jgi:hypothetical protein
VNSTPVGIARFYDEDLEIVAFGDFLANRNTNILSHSTVPVKDRSSP